MASTAAIQHFARTIGDEVSFGQALIRRAAPGFFICHADDRAITPGQLRSLDRSELRRTALFTDQGAFRPLRSAPDLARGWECRAADEAELEQALNDLYPGALADWHAVHTKFAAPTPFDAFARRQTGIYSSLQKLTEPEVQQTLAACCAKEVCLKQRLWTARDSLPLDSLGSPWAIPCLEPCAILMEFARRRAGWLREQPVTLELLPAEAQTVLAALKGLAANRAHLQADFANPLNARRALLSLEKASAGIKTNKSRNPATQGAEEETL